MKDPRARAEIWALGMVSFFTDLSSEIIFSVLPIYLVQVLGAPARVLGLMEGVADFAASSLDLASGLLSDRSGKRKSLALFGYATSTFSKGLLLFAASVPQVFAFRVAERLGKSIRGSPRDALLSSISGAEDRGFAFGLHKALDRAGAILGPLVAFALLAWLGSGKGAYQILFAVAFVPAVLSLFTLGLFVKERAGVPSTARLGIAATWGRLGGGYRRYLLTSVVFGMGYFSYAFQLLAAERVGFSAATAPLLYAGTHVAAVLTAVPIGKLGDRIGRRPIVLSGFLLHALSCGLAALALRGSASLPAQLLLGASFLSYGVFTTIDAAQARALVADLSEPELRATAFGLHGFATGLAYVPASFVAGLLWDWGTPAGTFAYGAGVSLLAMALFWLLFRARALGGTSVG